MTDFQQRGIRLVAALLAITLFGPSSHSAAVPVTPISTIQGQLVFFDCASVMFNADSTAHFTHKPICLARARHDHGRLLFPADGHVFHDMTFDLFVDKDHYYHLDELAPAARDKLFKALVDAAPAGRNVVISVTGPFDSSSKTLDAVSVRILKSEANYKPPYILEFKDEQ
jgi:hypothetical protein